MQPTIEPYADEQDLQPPPNEDPTKRYRDPEPEPYQERPEPRRNSYQGPSADTIGRAIRIFTALIAFIFVLHIIFVVAGANQHNSFVAFVYSVAKFFVFGLGDVFTPNDATIGVVLNYGLAAFIYLMLGRIISRALKR